MADSPKLIALRKALATPNEGLDSDAKKKMTEDAVALVLDAMDKGVCALGDWEKRCLAGAIVAIRSSKFDVARMCTRQALWPDENRRNASVAKLPPRPGMMTVPELRRELEAARALPRRGERGGIH